MKKRCVAIGGIPGTGKTTLMRKLLNSNISELKEFRKLVKGHEYDELIVLGDYSDNDKVFAGSDTFSMAVQPEAEAFFEENMKNVIFEGDRIFNSKMLEFIDSRYDLLVVILEADDAVVQERYKERGSEQSDKFINGRKTKYENVKKNSNIKVCAVNHNDGNDTDGIIMGINNFLTLGKVDFNYIETNSLDDFFS